MAAADKAIRTAGVLRSLPEQIADDIGRQIVAGEIAGETWLREIEMAEAYGVSRAPIREAIQLLVRQGLAEFSPRRGAQVLAPTLDDVIDTFNVMGVAIGLASSYFAALGTEADKAALGALADTLDAMAADLKCSPRAFAEHSWSTAHFLGRHCGSAQVDRMIAQQLSHTPWLSMWRHVVPDFQTPERRQQAAALNRERFEAICRGDGASADRLSRRMAHDSRDIVFGGLAQRRTVEFDPRRLKLDGAG